MITKSAMEMLGKHTNKPDTSFRPKELAMGVKVEHEHTDSPMVAKAIAKDHLSEIPDYYTRLRNMEREGKAALKKSAMDASPIHGPTLTDYEYRTANRGPFVVGLMKAWRTLRRAGKIGKAVDHHAAVLSGDADNTKGDQAAVGYNAVV